MSRLLIILSDLLVLKVGFPNLTTIKRHLLTQALVFAEFRRSFCINVETKKVVKPLRIVQGPSPLQKKKIYSQPERKYLAIVYGCEKNHFGSFLGRPFTTYSDH